MTWVVMAVSSKTTRYQVISECMDIFRGIKRSFSKNGAYQEPLYGYETAYAAVEEKINILQTLLREERYGKEAVATIQERKI